MNGGRVQAELTWVDGCFRPGVEIVIGEAGRFESVVMDSAGPPTHPGMAVLPGFVNAHSHSFQRGLRGRGELFPGAAEDFWTWREAMYELVESMDATRLRELARSAFREMRLAGITTVGEFHYLHHLAGGERFGADRIVLEAADEAGIRIVLLSAHYTRGGFDRPLAGGQRHFDTVGLEAYWESFDRLSSSLATNQSLGVVAHSLRAVPIDEVVELHAEANRRGLVMHLHVEEQRQEIEACRSATGATPSRLLLDRLQPGPECTAVHATHTAPDDLQAWLDRGCGICLCPLTEANLGDGFPDRVRMLGRHESVSIGSDSNARISMLEELRMLELSHRLHSEQRGAWRDADGRVDRVLLDMATTGGARALGIDAGRIAAGALADLVLVDLGSDSLQHVDPESLGAGLLLGADREAIVDTCVGGRWGGPDH
ncbi:MAG: formimidoylglutamate deiminase [Planctomycetota bacterium]|nr:formimidoylglutamate deiminase [Planctomycetota bacterium]